ncbi:TlpA disulfide reductase family protein [Paraflavitalea sp. CAU 1676]|uniref:TlpA family protein disulfide reductase n=1 Tax=Paraflavitalea sp. CAU 1676 TaxID=3032598 RepID=UPI0023DB278B|nr:TlpA disulfide reductase family protein [Paraflavitalea sp. CAU 1676]MDF2187819.1 TlpA disulfide reductase family protein [Paraflavitalea sp. CAU 1676]
MKVLFGILKTQTLQKVSIISLWFIGYAMIVQANEKAGQVVPERPAWGDTLQVCYYVRNAAAVINGKEPVYAKAVIWLQDGSYRWQVLLLAGTDTLCQRMVVPPGTASISIRFYTLNKDDEAAACKLLVYDKQSGQPVAGAYWEEFFSGDLRKLFGLEITRYPRHYLTYAKYFNVVSLRTGVEEAKAIIDSLLPALETARRTTRQPDAALLTACCVGYAKSGQLAAAKTCLRELLESFPQEAATELAFSLYNYEYYKSGGQQIEEDIRQTLGVICQRYPDAALAASSNVIHYVSTLQSLTVADFERVLIPQYAKGMMPYYGLDKLPGIYLERGEKLDSARSMLQRAIGYWQTGSIQHQYRLSASHYYMYVPYLMQLLAKVQLLTGEYTQAIGQSSAAISLLAGSNYEGNFLPDLLSIRARAYRKLGNLNMAMEDYKKLMRLGREEVVDSIRTIYPDCTVNEKEVDAFLASLRTTDVKAATGKKKPAPDFTGYDLQGNKVTLATLRGKVVLINFWSIGCGPCIGEMPALNKLVEKYRGNSEVVFLAVTGDEKDKLQQFFRKRRFLYQVVQGAGRMQHDYEVESLPVHIVIGKEGQVVDRSTGAREDITKYLDGIIQKQL